MDLEATALDLVDARDFLQPGVDVDAYDAHGATLTYIAAARGHTAMVELLADEGGADISKGTRDDDSVDGGACPLYIAAENGRVDTVRALIARGADVNQTTVNGDTPLSGAAYGGCAVAVVILLENGSNVNQARDDGVSPVSVASQEGHTAALKVLLENGGNVNQARNDDITPVWIASENEIGRAHV